jgi:lysozyme family protein
MASFAEYEDGYLRDWASLKIRDARRKEAYSQADRLFRGKETYQRVESKTGVPWWFVGLCHYREGSFRFDTYLGNGQPLNQETTIVPKNRGPFLGPDAFIDGCVDALRLEGFLGAKDWGIARDLYRLEGFNGYGYHAKGVNSPYLYGGSTAYGPPEARGGKYVRDHVFNPDVVDSQLGTAVILKALIELDSSIVIDGDGVPSEPIGQSSPVEPEDELAENILWIQRSLNNLGANPRLTEDGKIGPQTMAAISRFQQENGLADTGLADAPTISAIAQKSTTPVADQQSVTDGLAEIKQSLSQLRNVGKVTTSAPPSDLTAILQQVSNLLQNINTAPVASPSRPTLQPDQAAQLQKVFDFVSGLVNEPGKSTSLGQVNGALGQTIGNLLDGKKTAIGIVGALGTALLGNVPEGSGLADALAKITPLAGFSGYAMPIFLALTAWGTLGKLEKWSQGPAPLVSRAK